MYPLKNIIIAILLSYLRDFAFCLMVCLLVWVAFTSAIYQFKNPWKTQTQVFMHVPESFILDFGGNE